MGLKEPVAQIEALSLLKGKVVLHPTLPTMANDYGKRKADSQEKLIHNLISISVEFTLCVNRIFLHTDLDRSNE